MLFAYLEEASKSIDKINAGAHPRFVILLIEIIYDI